MRIAVYLDYLVANQLIAAAEAREEMLKTRIESLRRSGLNEESLALALVETISGELALRAAFDTIRLDADGETVAEPGYAPLAESELRAIFGDR